MEVLPLFIFFHFFYFLFLTFVMRFEVQFLGSGIRIGCCFGGSDSLLAWINTSWLSSFPPFIIYTCRIDYLLTLKPIRTRSHNMKAFHVSQCLLILCRGMQEGSIYISSFQQLQYTVYILFTTVTSHEHTKSFHVFTVLINASSVYTFPSSTRCNIQLPFQ